MIQQYLLGALAGGVVTALVALAAHRLATAKTTRRLRFEADRQVETLTQANAAQSERKEGRKSLVELVASWCDKFDAGWSSCSLTSRYVM